VLTWGSTGLTVSRTLQFSDLALDKPAYYPGDTMGVGVVLNSQRTARAPVTVRARLTDGLDRLLASVEREVTAVPEQYLVFELPVGDPLVTTATCHVQALVGGVVEAETEKTAITFPQHFADRQPVDWEHRLWGNSAGAYSRPFIARARSQQLKAFEVDCVLTSANWLYDREYEWPVRAGFRIMPINVAYGYISVGHKVPKGKMTFAEQRKNYQVTHDKKYLARPICLNDRQELAPLAEKLQRLADFAGWLEPTDYNLGDEMSTTYYVTPMDYDFAPAALDALRGWLQGQYEGLDALNREWNTTFTAWSEVVPMTTEEVKDRGNYAPWADHREFMDVTFAGFFGWIREQLRTGDPKAKVSLSGSQAAEAYGGYDWSRLSPALDFIQNYTHQNTVIMQRSFAPDLCRAPWYGYGVFNPRLRHSLWWRLFHGNFGASYFSLLSLLNPDMTFSGTATQALPLVREFKSGLALLLRNVERISDVGVHYSHASIRGAYVTGAAVEFRENRMGWIQVLEDLGFQCEFLSTAQIEAGELSKRDYPVFLLPYSVALSAAEAEALREYVRAGGLLIADGKTGLMDRHCRTLQRARLDALFGLARPTVEPLTPARPGEASFTRDLGECRLDGLRLDASVFDPDVELAEGSALGMHCTTPVGIVRHTGKGASVYLNLMMDSYLQRRKIRMEETTRQLVRQLLRLKSVQPPVPVAPQGDGDPRLFTVRYRDGAARYAGCVLEPGGGEEQQTTPFALELSTEGYVYDLRQDRALGRTRSVQAALAHGDAALFAVLPYRVTAVQTVPLSRDVAPGETVEVDIAIAAASAQPETHVVCTEITGPDGKVREHYSQKLVAKHGRARARFVCALNDPTGSWTLRATDFVTGVSGTCEITITER